MRILIKLIQYNMLYFIITKSNETQTETFLLKQTVTINLIWHLNFKILRLERKKNVQN